MEIDCQACSRKDLRVLVCIYIYVYMNVRIYICMYMCVRMYVFGWI